MSLGNKLKELRKRKNLTQQQVADMIGVKKNTITGYEKDQRQPDVLTLKRLIVALDATSEELLELPTFNDSDDKLHLTISDAAMKIAKLYDRLPPEGKEMLDKQAEMVGNFFKLV